MKPSTKYIGPLLLIFLVGTLFNSACNHSSTGKNTISVSGNIEITDARLGFKIPGLVIERAVSEGENVRVGQIVARLESRDLERETALQEARVQDARAALDELESGFRDEEIAQAGAAVERAEASLEELLNGSRPQDIAAAQATVRRAESEADRLRLDFDWQQALLRKKVVSQRDFDATQAAFQQAVARLEEAREHLALILEGPRRERIQQARAALKEVRERHRLLKNGPRPEDIAWGRARLKQAEESLALSRIQLEYATLTSPLTGVALSENIEPGEFVSPGTPVITVGDLENLWLRAYIANQTWVESNWDKK